MPGASAGRCRRVLQADSGMSRLGLSEPELDALVAEPKRLDGLAPRLVMSHFARAERQEHPMNREQLRRFEAARARLPKAPASLANSSGIFLGTDFHFDLVRPGAALYGLAPVRARQIDAARGPPEWPDRAGARDRRRRGGRLRRDLAGCRAAAHRHRRRRLRGRLPAQPLRPRNRLRRRHARAAGRHRLDGHRDLRRDGRARGGRGRRPRADRAAQPGRRARLAGRHHRLRNPHLPRPPLRPYLRGGPSDQRLTA
jgi:hypothetical protein